MMNREASFTKQRSSNPNLQLINVEASNGNQNGGTHSEALARSLNANARVRGKEGKKIQQRAIRGDRQMAEVLGLTKQKSKCVGIGMGVMDTLSPWFCTSRFVLCAPICGSMLLQKRI